jgi:hypothetical protein
MTLQPKRISVKFDIENPERVELEAFVPVFQQWIQQRAVEGLLIDVADYKHVVNGPGIVLIGHEGDYALDERGGRPGLLYTRKRDLSGDLIERLNLTFRLALTAVLKLEEEVSVQPLRFDLGSVTITFFDRLNTPNTPETLSLVSETTRQLVEQVYGSGEATLTPANDDPRECLALRVQVANVDRAQVSNSVTAPA